MTMQVSIARIIADFEEPLGTLRDLLESRGDRLVLVESCTAGMVSGILGQIPGISQLLCGSMVVYRNDCKRQWLGIDGTLLDDPKIGPVSQIVTEKLAISALTRTPEATVAGAITGHLGPDAPQGMDGLVFTCVWRRASPNMAASNRHQLATPTPKNARDWGLRQQRQLEAVRILINKLIMELAQPKKTSV